MTTFRDTSSAGIEQLKGFNAACAITEVPQTLDSSALRKRLASELERIGVRVVSESAARELPGRPCVLLSLDVIQPDSEFLMTYALHVRVREFATLKRKPRLATVTTWDGAVSGVAQREVLLETIHQELTLLMDQLRSDCWR